MTSLHIHVCEVVPLSVDGCKSIFVGFGWRCHEPNKNRSLIANMSGHPGHKAFNAAVT